MTRDTIYAALLRLYPRSFRACYGEEMMKAFSELSRDYKGSQLRFWAVIIRDCCRSLVREHLDAWSSRLRRSSLQWVIACAVGTSASGIGVLLLMLAYSYVSPASVDGGGVVQNRPQDLPVWAFGATMGLMLGATQAIALERLGWRRLIWISATALAGAIGFPLGKTVADMLGRGDFPGILIVGATTGLMQALAVGFRPGALRLVVWNTVALPVGIMCAIATTAFGGIRGPRNVIEIVTMFALMPLIPGAVIGMLTAASMTQVSPRSEFE